MKILVLSTWFPYPPDQGSRIRAFHLIKALSQGNELGLISFQDRPLDDSWLDFMKAYFTWIKVLPEKPFEYRKLRSILGFFSLKPAAAVAGFNKNMENLVLRTAQEWQPDLVFAFTNVTAPYALKVKNAMRIVDIDNLLTLMLHEDIAFAKNPLQKLRRYLAYLKFRRYENNLYKPFDRCLVVSAFDINRLQSYTKIEKKQILNVPNGVDFEFNQPGNLPKKENQLIYSGALTYAPNYDAMKFFLAEIYPLVQEQIPNIRLLITGSNTGVDLAGLSADSSVTFTGYVADIRPYIQESTLVIVPLRQGAGTRLKILEAMALGTAVISTSKGAEGLDLQHSIDVWIADEPASFASGINLLLSNLDLRKSLQNNAFHLVKNRYDWKLIEDQLAKEIALLTVVQAGYPE